MAVLRGKVQLFEGKSNPEVMRNDA
jgi:hypothetical protein